MREQEGAAGTRAPGDLAGGRCGVSWLLSPQVPHATSPRSPAFASSSPSQSAVMSIVRVAGPRQRLAASTKADEALEVPGASTANFASW